MKIKAVVVEGELPESCRDCDLMGALFPYSCQATIEGGYFKPIPDIRIRPDWCPLISERQEVLRVLDKVHG